MKGTSGQASSIRVLSVEVVLLLTICLLGTMVGISALRVRLVDSIAPAANTKSARLRATKPQAAGLLPTTRAVSEKSRRDR